MLWSEFHAVTPIDLNAKRMDYKQFTIMTFPKSIYQYFANPQTVCPRRHMSPRLRTSTTGCPSAILSADALVLAGGQGRICLK